MKKFCVTLAIISALTIPVGFAQTTEAPSALISALAHVPLSVQIGADDIFVKGLGFHAGASFYPLPIILKQELTVDIAADITYRSGEAPFFFYVGAGPRVTLLGSEWLVNQGAIGTYIGGGAVAGLEFDLDVYSIDVINIIGEVSVDYMFETSGQLDSGVIKPRFSIGVQIPLANLNVGQSF